MKQLEKSGNYLKFLFLYFSFYYFSHGGKAEIVFSDSSHFPDVQDVEKFLEPVVQVTIIVPLQYLSVVSSLCVESRGERGDVSIIDNERVLIKSKIPLAEVVIDFFERLKRLTR